MNLEEASFAILEELKRLRSDGVREIYLEDKTLEKFQNALNFNFSTENEINKRVVQRAGSEILPEGKDFEEDKKKSSLNVVSSLPPRSESVKNEKKFLKMGQFTLGGEIPMLNFFFVGMPLAKKTTKIKWCLVVNREDY